MFQRIWRIDKTLTSTTTSDNSRPGSIGNEEVVHASQIFKTPDPVFSFILFLKES